MTKPVGTIFAPYDTLRIHCPHCEYPHDEWYFDPRGFEFECRDCGEMFYIPVDTRVVITEQIGDSI
jgi:ribosomal protein S27E